MICVSLAELTCDALLKRLQQVAAKADMAEVRLDALADAESLDFVSLIKDRPCPFIFTNRSSAEGGLFSGPEEERTGLLEKAISAGADYVDIELRTAPALRDTIVKKVREAGTKLIISYHDFSCTSAKEKLIEVFDSERQAGADIGKIVTMAAGPQDVLKVFSLYFKALDEGVPLIAFCMGPFGKMSRLACLALGAYLTYASPARGHEAAPGQIPLDDLRAMVDSLNDTQ
ncbi:MAG: type I 3-dehydroquinate dehydratase [Deltaproteobacteria bacterium]|nr:MAG: type I 3-dehydroquinate dehydratase [Deltaproteobacteria bacterium]